MDDRSELAARHDDDDDDSRRDSLSIFKILDFPIEIQQSIGQKIVFSKALPSFFSLLFHIFSAFHFSLLFSHLHTSFLWPSFSFFSFFLFFLLVFMPFTPVFFFFSSSSFLHPFISLFSSPHIFFFGLNFLSFFNFSFPSFHFCLLCNIFLFSLFVSLFFSRQSFRYFLFIFSSFQFCLLCSLFFSPWLFLSLYFSLFSSFFFFASLSFFLFSLLSILLCSTIRYNSSLQSYISSILFPFLEVAFILKRPYPPTFTHAHTHTHNHTRKRSKTRSLSKNTIRRTLDELLFFNHTGTLTQ